MQRKIIVAIIVCAVVASGIFGVMNRHSYTDVAHSETLYEEINGLFVSLCGYIKRYNPCKY